MDPSLNQTYTVKEVCDFSGVSARTLHYYDEIDLLKPASIGQNGYRYYDEQSLLLLQQILFFRELGIKLVQIKTILYQPQVGLTTLLNTHKRNLVKEKMRIVNLIETIDDTIAHLNGEKKMNEKQFFSGFDEAQQKEYENEIAQKYGENNQALKQSKARWTSYSDNQKEQIMREGSEITQAIADHIGIHSYDAPETQAEIARWHDYINQNFYDCSLEIFAGLGQMYNTDPRFIKNYQKVHKELPQFLEDAITYYCVENS